MESPTAKTNKRRRADDDDPNEKERTPKRTKMMDTEPLLKIQIDSVKNSRKEKRSMTLAQKIDSSRKHFLNDNLDPGVTPGPAESKLTYGARMPLAPVMMREQYEQHNPEVLYDMPDIDEVRAETLGQTERQAMDLKNIASHFLGSDSFKESSDNASASVSAKSGGKTKRALQTDGTTRAPHNTQSTMARDAMEIYAKATDRETKHQIEVRVAMDTQAVKNRQRRATNRERRRTQTPGDLHEAVPMGDKLTVSERYKDDPALFGGAPKDNSEFAIMNWRGLYDVSKQDIDSFKALDRKKIKPRSRPEEFMIPTDAPPAGNANVVAARRSFLVDQQRFNSEARDALDNTKQHEPTAGALPRVTGGGVPISETQQPLATALYAVETRDVMVVDPQVYAASDDPLQQFFKTKGDRFAESMATTHRRPSSFTTAGIDNPYDRMMELGHDPTQPELADLLEEDEIKGLGTRYVDEDSTVQPLVRYFSHSNEKANRIGAMGMANQLVLDQAGALGTLIPRMKRWKTKKKSTSGDAMEIDVEPDKVLDVRKKTLTKILTEEARRDARNVKKQREAVGSQASFDPPRRRTRFCHNKTRYCLDLLRQNNIFFCNDRVAFSEGHAMVHGYRPEEEQLTRPNLGVERHDIVSPDRAQPSTTARSAQRLLESSRGGLLGALMQRLFSRNASRPAGKVGSDHFGSAYELGTDRLHPSSNPDLPVVRMEYHLKYAEQARPDINPYERECFHGRNCWCYSRNSQNADMGTYFEAKNAMSFICKEFLLPSEETRARLHGVLPAKRKSCIMCLMQLVTQTTVSLQFSGTLPNRVINDHRVIIGQEGQYAVENCIPVSYQRGGKRLPTGIVGHFPTFNELFFRHSVRLDGNVEIRFVTYSPSVTGFC